MGPGEPRREILALQGKEVRNSSALMVVITMERGQMYLN
jgi:hypothetical protein